MMNNQQARIRKNALLAKIESIHKANLNAFEAAARANNNRYGPTPVRNAIRAHHSLPFECDNDVWETQIESATQAKIPHIKQKMLRRLRAKGAICAAARLAMKRPAIPRSNLDLHRARGHEWPYYQALQAYSATKIKNDRAPKYDRIVSILRAFSNPDGALPGHGRKVKSDAEYVAWFTTKRQAFLKAQNKLKF